MHHFESKEGFHFNFNSDMSGDVRVSIGYDEVSVSGLAMLEFVKWYIATYEEGDSPASADEHRRWIDAAKRLRDEYRRHVEDPQAQAIDELLSEMGVE